MHSLKKIGKRDIICKFGSYFTSYVRNEDLVDLEKQLVSTQHVLSLDYLSVTVLHKIYI